MLRKYCLDTERDSDEGVPIDLFAAQEVVQELLGFSPAELVFSHTFRNSLGQFTERLHQACSFAKAKLCGIQHVACCGVHRSEHSCPVQHV